MVKMAEEWRWRAVLLQIDMTTKNNPGKTFTKPKWFERLDASSVPAAMPWLDMDLVLLKLRKFPISLGLATPDSYWVAHPCVRGLIS